MLGYYIGQSTAAMPAINLTQAIQRNQFWAGTGTTKTASGKTVQGLGWGAYRGQIERVLGLPPGSDEAAFAQAVARWQSGAGLEADGVLGPNGWARLKLLVGKGPGAGPAPGPAGGPVSAYIGGNHPWDPVIAVISTLEGGHDAVNMWDNQVLSWGVLQWSLLSGNLTALLLFIKNRLGSAGFAARFPGIDVLPGTVAPTLIAAGAKLEIPSQMQKQGYEAKVYAISQALRSAAEKKAHWTTVFRKAGQDPAVAALQREFAFSHLQSFLKVRLGENYGRVGDYFAGTYKALTLAFGVYVHYPSAARQLMRSVVDQVAAAFGGNRSPSAWRGDWPRMIADTLEASGRRDSIWKDSGKRPRIAKLMQKMHSRPGFPGLYAAPGGAGPVVAPPASQPTTPSAPASTPSTGFALIAFENPGGGRIKDKRDPAPADLVKVPTWTDGTRPLHKVAAAAHAAMVEAARRDGIPHPHLLLTSGYRSTKEQEKLWAEALKKYGSEEAARKWVAKPGGSPHHSGRAVDLKLDVNIQNSSGNVAKLRQTGAYKWLVANAVKFGFYPYEAEPWHWEYNPRAK